MPGFDSDILSIDRLENLPTIGLSESALLRRDLLLTISKNLKRIHVKNKNLLIRHSKMVEIDDPAIKNH